MAKPVMKMNMEAMLTYCIPGEIVSNERDTVSNTCEPVAIAQPQNNNGFLPTRSIIIT